MPDIRCASLTSPQRFFKPMHVPILHSLAKKMANSASSQFTTNLHANKAQCLKITLKSLTSPGVNFQIKINCIWIFTHNIIFKLYFFDNFQPQCQSVKKSFTRNVLKKLGVDQRPFFSLILFKHSRHNIERLVDFLSFSSPLLKSSLEKKLGERSFFDVRKIAIASFFITVMVIPLSSPKEMWPEGEN